MGGYEDAIAKSDEQIAQLLSERPQGWEYLLFAGALCAGVERLETKYSDYSLGYAPRLGIMIERQQFADFINSQLDELNVMIGTLDALFSPTAMEDALGPPGIAGDPDKVLHAASRVVRLYEDVLLWAERLRGMAMRSEHREIVELLVQFSGQPVNELRDFVHRFGAQVNEIPSLIAKNERIVIDETVKFSIPRELVQSFNAKIQALKR